MLGQAPGTDRLNEWSRLVDDHAGDGMNPDESVDALANHIAETEAFEAKYPFFLSSERFAKEFLGDLLGDNVSAEVMAGAEGIVAGMLNDGMTRGTLALFLVNALLDIAAEIAAGEEPTDLHGAFGMAATAFHNKVMVAEHYTVEARMAEPSASVLDGVTADADSVMMAKDAIDNPVMEDPMMGMRYVLTPTIDEVMGGDADDTIVAQPIQGASSIFQETLNPFDSIDGGGGDDTIYIYGVDPDAELALVSEDISNVENVVLNTVGAIRAEMVSWEGLMAVDLHRFGHDDKVSVTVDGAMVSTDMTFGGEKVMIAGASGTVDIEASHSTMVHIGSAGHTESVMVKNGGNIMIGKNGDGGGQSMTVTTVSVDGVKAELGKDVPGDPNSAPYMAMTDDNGYVVGQNGTDRISIQVGPDGTPVVRVGIRADGTLTNADTGDAIPVTFNYDHDSDGSEDSPTAEISVTAELKFNSAMGGIVLGKVTTTGDTTAFPVADATQALDGMALPEGVVVIPTPSIGKERGEAEDVAEGAMPTLTINSDAIETVHLHNTNAIALVHNNSMTADRKRMPEDLSVTVNKYGDKDQDGKLGIAGMGSAENVMLTVAGDSWVDLNSNHVKMLDISADAKLSLKVRKFNADDMPVGPSETLESVMVSGEGAVSMNSLDGMKKLASIDASGSSGNNSFKSMAELAALTMVMGGTGNDTVGLMTSRDGKLESIDTGGGNDTVMLSGDTYREGGLMVDLGDGDDTFHGGPGNSMSRVDGGDGRDTLRLSGDGDTYKDGDKTMSIYSNFEVLDVGGGSGPYDVGRLGVDSVIIGKSTVGSGVALNNVGGGTSLSVSAEKAGTGTEAKVSYTFANDVNVAGSIIDGGTTNVLNVSLMAKGGSGDKKTSGRTAIADLEITLDGDLLAMAIDSDASVHRTAAGKGVTSGHYQNKVEVAGTSALEEVKITGDAQTHLSGAGLASLEYVNAAESGAGVAVDASSATGRVRLVGSHHDDDLTVGAFAGTATVKNTLVGNGGNDMLTGGAGMDLLNGGAGADTLRGDPAGGTQVEDLFIYNAASESQVTFTRNDKTGTFDAKGYDKIMDFTSTTDKLHLSKALHAIVTAGGIKSGTEWEAASGNTTPGGLADGRGWNPVDQDGAPGGATVATTSIDGTPNKAVTGDSPVNADGGALNLYEFIGSGRGLFMTTVVGQPTDFGATTRQVKNSLAIVSQTTTGDQGTWLLVDVDADGNFDADTDMAIFLAGDTPVDFVAANDLSM